MVETAAHLADHVIPRLPVRQWVLAVPKRLRYFLHLIIAGTTKISNIDAIIPAAPYVYGEREIRLNIGMIEADLPNWLDVAILGFAMILPTLTMFLPAIISSTLMRIAPPNVRHGSGSQLPAIIARR
jgi:hypothetical protein